MRPSGPSQGKVGVIGTNGAPASRASEPGVAEHRVDLLGADDRHRDDRRLRAQRDLDEAAAAEALQPVALRERLAGPLHPLGEDHHQVVLLERAGGVVRARREPADAAHEGGEEGQDEGPVQDHELRPPRQRVLLHDRRRDHRGVEREQRAGVVGDDQRPAVRGDVDRARRPGPATSARTGTRRTGRRPRRTPRRSPTRPRGSRPACRRAARSTESRRFPRQPRGGALGGRGGVEAGADPAAEAAQEARRSPRPRRCRCGAFTRLAPQATRGPAGGPRCARATSRRSRLRRPDRVEARLVAELLAEPGVVDPAAVAEQAQRVAVGLAGAEARGARTERAPARRPDAGSGPAVVRRAAAAGSARSIPTAPR